MHQSFVTTAPPPPPHIWGIAGTTTFHPNSPTKSPVLQGPAESHSPALYKSKFLGVYLRNITSPALTRYCGGTQKVIAPHVSPAILVGGGGGGGGRGHKWLVHYDISPGHFSLKKQNRLLRQRQGLFRGWSWLFAGTRPPENSAVAISVRRFLTRGGHLGEFHCATWSAPLLFAA